MEAPKFYAVDLKTVVLQRGLDGIRMQGAAMLDHEPDDFDERYRAKRRIHTLPLPLQGAPGRTVALFTLSSSKAYGEFRGPCEAKLGTVAAYASAESRVWDELPRDRIAARTFEQGSSFVGADIVGQCPLKRWATFEPPSALVFWRVESASIELLAAARDAASNQPSHVAKQRDYAQIEKSINEVTAAVERERARDPAARERFAWFQGSKRRSPWRISADAAGVAWIVQGPVEPALLIAYFDSSATVSVPNLGIGNSLSLPPGTLRRRVQGPEERLEIFFDGRLVHIWTLDAARKKLVKPIGDMASDPATGQALPNFKLRAAVSKADGLPTLLFTVAWVNGALRPIHGRYAVDRDLMIAPANIGEH